MIPIPPDTPAEETFRAFLRAYGRFRLRMESYFAPFGISGAQWGALRQLHRAEITGEEALHLNDLGRRLLVRPPSVSMLVERLQRAGLVRRMPSETDRRAKKLQLTATGRRLVQRIHRVHLRQIESVLSGLSANERQTLRRLLDRFAPVAAAPQSSSAPLDSKED